jgi:hypothetical protein
VEGDDGPLFVGERAGLEEERFRYQVLAEVVQVRAEFDLPERRVAARPHEGGGEGAREDGRRPPVRVDVSVKFGLLFAAQLGGGAQDSLRRPSPFNRDTTAAQGNIGEHRGPAFR